MLVFLKGGAQTRGWWGKCAKKKKKKGMARVGEMPGMGTKDRSQVWKTARERESK